ncbi:DUF6844 domain-containing protein [Planctobacterium marinum]|uniref:DUF6844 domain-containing protein n=1 Tax=Planctobacterium marinum TaxID=1631968 RepID=UPI001E2A8A88|nr:hypothetical protein [Planctobacterium marinum]MCC2605659.1 hypothetical protein [Planctobacterium marinum]
MCCTKKLLTLFMVVTPVMFTSQSVAQSTAQAGEILDVVMIEEQAQQPAATGEEVVQAQEEKPADAAAYVDEKAQQYIRDKRRKFATQNKQVFMHAGTAIISLRPTESGWGDARVLAYTEAMQKAREAMLKQLYTNVATETIRKSFKSNQLPEFTPEEIQAQSQFEALLDKIVALADATVDGELRELGVNPEEYDAAPPSKRKTMMQKAVTQTVETVSMGDITGTQIMKSYEKTDSNGNTAVSVVIATSVRKKNFLASLRKSKGNIEPEPEKAKLPVLDYLEQHQDNLMYQIGTKIHWDEKGYPVLLSFGMAGNDCNPADYEECVDNREFSYLDAELNAFAHIAETYNLVGRVEATSSSTSDKSRTASATMNSPGDIETQEQTVAKVIKEISQMSKVSSNVKGLVGLQQVKRWSSKHPVTNREINGVVLMWHPMAEQATRAFKNNKELKKNKPSGSKATITPVSGESDGADDDDF